MATEKEPTLDIQLNEQSATLVFSGELTIHQLTFAQARVDELGHKEAALSAVDLTKLTHLDTAGAFYLRQWVDDIPLRYRDDSQRHVLELMGTLSIDTIPHPQALPPVRRALVDLGRIAEEGRDEAVRVITFGGKSAVMLTRAVAHPHRLRIGAIAQQVNAIGIQALPIIGLMAFLISIVLAYQGVAQLRPYGGEQFTVNLVALSILREMGVLLTAIMVAGRSGSAFTAEIGVMKAREEVDALQVMGLSPFDMLVTPRLIAIVIALPLLTFYADIMGLTGGFIICHSLIGISLPQYIDRVHQAVAVKHLLIGLSKAPVFAFVIGMVGCMHGLRVSGSAESIGQETTRAVVKSIFLVLVLDAFFSILFEQLGL
jgi:phospholipid/cholesterol/gamma-HCH transport system permease protein